MRFIYKRKITVSENEILSPKVSWQRAAQKSLNKSLII